MGYMAAKKQDVPDDQRAGLTQVPGRTDDGLSNQSHFSSYEENGDVPEANPPTGKQVLEERGSPSKGPVDYSIQQHQ